MPSSPAAARAATARRRGRWCWAAGGCRWTARGRTLDGREVQLKTWQAFSGDDRLAGLVMERMLAGLATRRHTQAAEPVGEVVEQAARATSKSAISRRFVAQTAKALEELLARDLSEVQVVWLLLDGIYPAERCCVVALAILADGRKLPVGLWEGSTENATVVRHLLADLQGRGLDHQGACWWSSTAPRRWPRRCAACSVSSR